MTGHQLFGKYVLAGLCTGSVYLWEDLNPVMQGRWNTWAERLAAPDFRKIGDAFGVGPEAARDYFQGGDLDPAGAETISLRIHVEDPMLLEYGGKQYVRRLLIACIKAGVPTDQLNAIEHLANSP